jgi:hypothetical protein
MRKEAKDTGRPEYVGPRQVPCRPDDCPKKAKVVDRILAKMAEEEPKDSGKREKTKPRR